jgi:hypothetical protein
LSSPVAAHFQGTSLMKMGWPLGIVVLHERVACVELWRGVPDGLGFVWMVAHQIGPPLDCAFQELL